MFQGLLPRIRIPTGTGEIQFKAAKALWENIKETFTKPFQTEKDIRAYLALEKQILEVLNTLYQAQNKNHYEATRCYCGLLLLHLTKTVKLLKKESLSFDELKKFHANNKAYFNEIVKLLDKPAFKEDPFSLHVLSAALMFNRELYCQKMLENWDRLPEMNSPFLAYAIVKAKELDYSIPLIQQAFENAKATMEYPDWQFLFVLQSRELLEQLKAYTLEDAKEILKNIKLPLEPVRCEFFELPLPSEKEVRAMIDSLLILIGMLEMRGNTQTFLPILQQGASEYKEEKTQPDEKRSDVTTTDSIEKMAPVDLTPEFDPPAEETPAPTFSPRRGMVYG